MCSWECTGSRDPIRHHLHQAKPKPLKSPISRLCFCREKLNMKLKTNVFVGYVLLDMIRELIPQLTREMERIINDVKKHSQNCVNLQDNQVRQYISKAYLEASQRITEDIAIKYGVSVFEFQDGLLYYHDDAVFKVRL
jgi:hypothetical protein